MLNDNEIICAIEKNLFDFYSFINDNKTSVKLDNSLFIHTKNQVFSWPNFLFKQEILKSITEPEIINLKEWLSINIATKIILNNLNIVSVENYIKKYNFFPIAKWSGMYLKLEKDLEINFTEGFVVEEVRTFDDLKIWFEIVNSEVLKNSNLNYEVIKKMFADDFLRCFLGKLSDIPVTTASVFSINDFNGLYFIATKKEFQNRGLGSQTVKSVINTCLKGAYKNFILHATKMGESIYKKIGFREYSKIYIFTTLNK